MAFQRLPLLVEAASRFPEWMLLPVTGVEVGIGLEVGKGVEVGADGGVGEGDALAPA